MLAILSLPRVERRRFVVELQSQAITVLQIPSVDELTSRRARSMLFVLLLLKIC